MATFYRHEEWEEIGMYKSTIDADKVNQSTVLLRSADLRLWMDKALQQFPKSGEMVISNVGRNHQSWLGQAACYAHHGANDRETCSAWFILSADERAAANSIADQVIQLARQPILFSWDEYESLKNP